MQTILNIYNYISNILEKENKKNREVENEGDPDEGLVSKSTKKS